MKAYVVLEGADNGPPRDNSQLVYGVFLTRKGASECLERHARYISSLDGLKLTEKAGKAIDGHGNVHIQIVECEVDVCRRETWI